ncbi:MAG: hypothetical protein NTZ84_03620 [Candidatus Nealsonbacteria bacterium]|nr:hypothetical protein [Candidatus Nealsonbacteria bacterium]
MEKAKSIALILGVLVMIFVVGYLAMAWTEPTQLPPGGNVPAPLNIGITAQSKEGALVVGANSGVTTGLIVRYGNVGIGTTGPSQKLEVNGNILATGDVCNGAGACLSQIASWIGGQSLVFNVHTYAACTAAGGTVVASDVSLPQCRFDANSCPSTWTQYKEYRTPAAINFTVWTGGMCNNLSCGVMNCRPSYCSCTGGCACTLSFVAGIWGNVPRRCERCYCSCGYLCCCNRDLVEGLPGWNTQIGCY